MMTQTERERLRMLAQKQLEVYHSPVNQERIQQWFRHNACQPGRPMVHVEMDTFEEEVLMPKLQCESPIARRLEADLYRNFMNITEFDDDWVTPNFFGIRWESWFHPLGHEITAHSATDTSGRTVGHQFDFIIEDLEDDWDKLGETKFGVNKESTEKYFQAAQEAFGDILPAKMIMQSPGAVPTQQVVHLMGMENMCFAMYDYPDLFKELMDRIADGYLAYFDYLTKEDFLLPTAGFELLNQGSKCFTKDLPADHVTDMKQMWGFMDSQETVSISPEMFHEFIFPCYQKIGARYGKLSYGCCEPVSAVWDDIKTFPNLCKVSISPWCDEEFMGQQLKGSKIIYHRKPSPNYLGVGETMDEEGLRKHIQKTLKAAEGCTLEFTQRDVYTLLLYHRPKVKYKNLAKKCKCFVESSDSFKQKKSILVKYSYKNGCFLS